VLPRHRVEGERAEEPAIDDDLVRPVQAGDVVEEHEVREAEELGHPELAARGGQKQR
jgi:hypothetical protein